MYLLWPIQLDATRSERFVRLSGKVTFPNTISLGDDITVTIGGHSYVANCVKQEMFDNQDGSVNQVYVLKPTLE